MTVIIRLNNNNNYVSSNVSNTIQHTQVHLADSVNITLFSMYKRHEMQLDASHSLLVAHPAVPLTTPVNYRYLSANWFACVHRI